MKSIIGIALIGLITSSIGCSGTAISTSNHSYTFNKPVSNNQVRGYFIDSEFSKEDKKEIKGAFDTWNFVLNGSIKYEEKSDGVITIIKTKRYGDITPPTVHAIAWVNSIDGDIVYISRDRILSQRALREVMLHEIGHLLGALHNPNTLMNPQFDLELYQCIDRTTVKQVAKANGLDLNQLNYCVRFE